MRRRSSGGEGLLSPSGEGPDVNGVSGRDYLLVNAGASSRGRGALIRLHTRVNFFCGRLVFM